MKRELLRIFIGLRSSITARIKHCSVNCFRDHGLCGTFNACGMQGMVRREWKASLSPTGKSSVGASVRSSGTSRAAGYVEACCRDVRDERTLEGMKKRRSRSRKTDSASHGGTLKYLGVVHAASCDSPNENNHSPIAFCVTVSGESNSLIW